MSDRRAMRRVGGAIVAAGAVGLAMSAPAGAQEQGLQASGVYINQGTGSTTTSISIDGNQLTVRVEAMGVAPGLPHAQHIHGELGTEGSCPALAEVDADGDGNISTVEGVANYGTVKISLTTEGDTSPDSALAIDRFPVADDDGTYTYERTFEVDAEIAESLEGWVAINHGVDLDQSGEYDGDLVSSLDDSLPLEATMPATCGVLVAAQVETTPTGAVEAGAGGTADDARWSWTGWTLGALAALFGFSALGAGRELLRVRTDRE